MKPNYTELGLSCTMGTELRNEVQRQLSTDLKQYGFVNDIIKFDWSESCVEGKSAYYLDGSLDRFSGIKLFDNYDNLIADGWMDFIYEKSENLFVVYWEYLDIMREGTMIPIKLIPGIPDHIIKTLPSALQQKYAAERQVSD